MYLCVYVTTLSILAGVNYLSCWNFLWIDGGPEAVKAKLKQWAQMVACSVLQSPQSAWSILCYIGSNFERKILKVELTSVVNSWNWFSQTLKCFDLIFSGHNLVWNWWHIFSYINWHVSLHYIWKFSNVMGFDYLRETHSSCYCYSLCHVHLFLNFFGSNSFVHCVLLLRISFEWNFRFCWIRKCCFHSIVLVYW